MSQLKTLVKLKGWQVWSVDIRNNYNGPRYPDYGARAFDVVAASPEEARAVVLNNADAILGVLLKQKLHNGKKILSKTHAISIDNSRIGNIKVSSLIAAQRRPFFTPEGLIELSVESYNVVL
jgi:hypothetical protein